MGWLRCLKPPYAVYAYTKPPESENRGKVSLALRDPAFSGKVPALESFCRALALGVHCGCLKRGSNRFVAEYSIQVQGCQARGNTRQVRHHATGAAPHSKVTHRSAASAMLARLNVHRTTIGAGWCKLSPARSPGPAACQSSCPQTGRGKRGARSPALRPRPRGTSGALRATSR